jgi:hypothetical protein
MEDVRFGIGSAGITLVTLLLLLVQLGADGAALWG